MTYKKNNTVSDTPPTPNKPRGGPRNCALGEAKPGHHSAEYRAYKNAKMRCNNSKHDSYKYYGGRGIKFLYTSYPEFLADVGRRPSPAFTLDRKETNGNYEPGNCQWATWAQQVETRRKPEKKPMQAV